MAGGDTPDCYIVPTRESHLFRLRARLPSPDDPRPIESLQWSSTTVAGRECIACYWPADKSTHGHVTFSLHLTNQPVLEAAAKVSTHMVLLDRTGSPAPSIGKTMGASRLEAQIDDIKAYCVVDNYFELLCYVDTDWTAAFEEELPDLGHDLAMMLDKQEHTDVSFNVGGESFSAHRLVLAARSPVFKAELYGPMAESKMATITIQDMEASTFRSMLHYLYHGSLPSALKTDVHSTVAAEYQHLLIAADRYGIERLKKTCENKLCADGITIDSVVSMLELAEYHVCAKLKAMCLDFLSDGEIFRMVATTDAYFHLMQTVPSLSVEVRNRFKMANEKPTITTPGAHKKTRMCVRHGNVAVMQKCLCSESRNAANIATS